MGAAQQILVAGAGATGPTVTWNPSDKASLIVLSGSDLIAGRTGSNTYQSVRATLARSGGGKFYAEFLMGAVTPTSIMVGLAKSTADLNSYCGSGTDSWGYNQNGSTYNVGSQSTGFASYAASDVIQIAYDPATGKMWWGKNNTWQGSGDPAAGTNARYAATAGTALFPMCSIFEGGSGQTVRGRFKSSDFTYSPPSGFSAWQ